MGVLSSLRILDFSVLLPGPFASLMLADLGAEVVRVENPNLFDMVRACPPFDGEDSAFHAYLNRSKRSLALDLNRPGSVQVIQRLVQKYDIVLESFRPGTMDRLGVGYEALKAVNPRVIHCSLTGYGQTGPLRDRAGHDINYMALAGLMSHSGRREAGPVPQGCQVADIGGGSCNALVGILAAVIHRQQTGEGQCIDVSMFDGALTWNTLAATQELGGGEGPDYESMVLNGGSVYDYYRTRDGRYLSVGSLEPKFWQGFCEAIGRADLAAQWEMPDPLTAATKGQVRAVIAERTLDEWRAVFADQDVCAEPVLTVREALEQPQTAARGMVVNVPKPDGAAQPQLGCPIVFSGADAEYRHTGSRLGEHTDEVLREIGYCDAEIQQFREGGMFG